MVSNLKRKLKNKKALINMLGGKCEVCGYNKCIKALDFHHRDPKQKKFSISSGLKYKMETLIKEAKKCILLCSNCHREEHDKK